MVDSNFIILVVTLPKPEITASPETPYSATLVVTKPAVNAAIKDSVADQAIRYRVVDTATNTVTVSLFTHLPFRKQIIY